MDVQAACFGIDPDCLVIADLVDGKPQFDEDEQLICKRWESDTHPERPTLPELEAGLIARRSTGEMGDWDEFYRRISVSSESGVIIHMAQASPEASIRLNALAELIGQWEGPDSLPNILATHKELFPMLIAGLDTTGLSILSPIVDSWNALIDETELPIEMYFSVT